MIEAIVKAISPLSDKSIREIEGQLLIEEIPKGQTFIHKGKINSKEYFLLAGICSCYLINPEGEKITLSFFTTESVLSPHTIRTSNGISVLNFQALTDATLASINAKTFEEMIVKNLEIRDFANMVLRTELARMVSKEIGLASLTARERLLQFRANYPLLENLIPHPDIASYLGITNVSLSRLRKDLYQ